MATSTFGLLFLEPRPPDFPGPPVSHVFVKSSSRMDYRGVQKNLALLTPQAMSSNELSSYIDKMCEELQEIKRSAARKHGAAAKRLKDRRQSK